MRIISGERRGHRFDGPDDSSTRPTSDMVRESIFNILAGRVEDRQVYDLFAGTGALGLEAVSRGASHAVFVERDRKNVALIRKNISILRFEGRGAVVLADAFRWAKTFATDDPTPILMLIDPPYREFQEKPERIFEMLDTLVGKLPDGSTVVVESDRDHGEGILPEPESWDIRRYGGTQVAIRDIERENGDDHGELGLKIPVGRSPWRSSLGSAKGAYEALWAGGCVRDLLLGIEPSDYDVATDARPEAVMSLFRRTVPVGVSFGVVRVIGPKIAGEVEVATFRSDGNYLDGRRPESVTFGIGRAGCRRVATSRSTACFSTRSRARCSITWGAAPTWKTGCCGRSAAPKPDLPRTSCAAPRRAVRVSV